MSPFLETPQVSLSQRPCLEWAEALSMQTVGDLANKLVKNGEAPQPHTEGQKLQIGLKIAGTMIQGWLDAHIDRVTEEPSPRGDLLDSFRRFMYQYVGHPEREQRYNHENPVPIRDHRPGARQVFSRQGLAPELLQHDIHPLAQHDTNVRRIFAAAAA